MRRCVAGFVLPLLMLAACGRSPDGESPSGKAASGDTPAEAEDSPVGIEPPDPDDLRFKPTVRFHAEGRYEGPAVLTYKQPEGSGDVTDTVVLDFTVDLDKGELIGPVTFRDGTTEVKRSYNVFKDCAPPDYKGGFEYFTARKASLLDGALLQVEGVQDHPAMKANVLCPGSMALSTVAAKSEPLTVNFMLLDPRAVRMGYAKDVTMGADGRSFSMFLKDSSGEPSDNWRWEVGFEILSLPKQ